MPTVAERAGALQECLVQWRRHIHQNPEVGMDTAGTAAFVKAELEKMGYTAHYVAGTGVTALAGDPGKGKCFLLRADMDALPFAEETDLAFKSTNGNMHACGHDFHTAMLLGAAKLLKEREADIPGCVKFMFQPAEENLKGAAAMLEAGILENPRVDAGAMFHVSMGSALPTGHISVPLPEASCAAADWFEVLIRGKGGHGARPHQTVDPLNVISHLHLALQALNSREIAPDSVAALTVGMMQGGTTANVIPDTAEMRGTIRTFDEAVRDHLVKRVSEMAKSVAATFRAEAVVTMTSGCPNVDNNERVADICAESLTAVFGDMVHRHTTKSSGSEDFAYLTKVIPAIMMTISAGSAADGHTTPLHHPKVVLDEKALCNGAAAYAVAALGWLTHHL
ncbi:MAG: amidohydrolase [Ruminococcaceae bacterium]|nr:amidohydrolase [Oscillospiraceae bacterium]